MRKYILRTIWVVLVLMLVGAGALLTLAHWNKSAAEHAIKKALRTYCKGDVRFKWSSFGFFERWGELTFSLHQVQIVQDNETVGRIGQVHFSLGFSALWGGECYAPRVYVEELDADMPFWQCWQSADKENKWGLKQISVEKARFSLTYAPNDLVLLDFERVGLEIGQNLYALTATAEAGRFQYLYQKRAHWEIRDIRLKSELSYSPTERVFYFSEGNLRIRQADFALRGTYSPQNAQPLDIRFRAREDNLQSLLALLPAHYYEEFSGYKANGNITLSGAIKGKIGNGTIPTVEATFGGQNFEIVSPYSSQEKITNCHFEGNLSGGTLRVMELNGRFGTQRFKGAFTLQDWQNPHLVGDIEAGIDLGALHAFYPLAHWEQLKGLAGIKLHLDTDIAELRKQTTEAKKLIAAGEFELINVSAKPRVGKLYDRVNAKVIFQNDLADIRNMEGKWGDNDLRIKGRAQNWLACLFSPAQMLHFKGTLGAKFLSLDDFVRPSLALPAHLQGQIRLEIDSLAYQDWRARKIKADASLKDKVLKSGNLTFEMASGNVSFLGILNGQKENFITLDGRIIAKGMQASQLKRGFDWLGKVSGKFDADIRGGLVLDKQLAVKWTSAVCDAELNFSGGELEQVQVLQDLAQKVQIPDIKKLKFREMHALLQVRNQTLFVPEWELTGEHNIGLIGRATVEKGLDFRLRLQPKRNLVYHVNWTGGLHNVLLSFPPETEQPHLESFWKREKESYLKIFKRNTAHELIKMDTIRIGE